MTQKSDSGVSTFYLPVKRQRLFPGQALMLIQRSNPSEAVALLETTRGVEFGYAGPLYPHYVRGQAYLAAHQGTEAAVEFQKILDRRGIVQNSPIGVVAHLDLARAYVLIGDDVKAKAAYEDFFTLWKDADPDIPILTTAKSEYAKLH